jgi:hypothetical protein
MFGLTALELADPIRVHDVIPHHFPGDHHRPCELSRGTGRPVVVEERHHLIATSIILRLGPALN